ncbi:MAG TPA: MarC family protein [Burkholderiales bacterium]|jgi:multiple antibiotic resistance protein|nr:MarC family protein [Burkholderiales bacterium]
MLDWTQLVKLTVTLVAIVDPIAALPVFLSATGGLSRAARNRVAVTVTLTVFGVLTASALFGKEVLALFGISLPSFQIGGGILFLLLAVSMLQAKESWIRQTPAEAEEAIERAGLAIVPLAIPLLAGPGAITTMIIAAHESPSALSRLGLLLPAALIAAVVWLTLISANRISERLGQTGINIITRVMGLIIAAIAIEFIYKGLVELFPKLR